MYSHIQGIDLDIFAYLRFVCGDNTIKRASDDDDDVDHGVVLVVRSDRFGVFVYYVVSMKWYTAASVLQMCCALFASVDRPGVQSECEGDTWFVRARSMHIVWWHHASRLCVLIDCWKLNAFSKCSRQYSQITQLSFVCLRKSAVIRTKFLLLNAKLPSLRLLSAHGPIPIFMHAFMYSCMCVAACIKCPRKFRFVGWIKRRPFNKFRCWHVYMHVGNRRKPCVPFDGKLLFSFRVAFFTTHRKRVEN